MYVYDESRPTVNINTNIDLILMLHHGIPLLYWLKVQHLILEN